MGPGESLRNTGSSLRQRGPKNEVQMLLAQADGVAREVQTRGIPITTGAFQSTIPAQGAAPPRRGPPCNPGTVTTGLRETCRSVQAPVFKDNTAGREDSPADGSSTGSPSGTEEQSPDPRSSLTEKTSSSAGTRGRASGSNTGTGATGGASGSASGLASGLCKHTGKRKEVHLGAMEDVAERKKQRRLAKNRATAALSRERRRAQMASLQELVNTLEQDNANLSYALSLRNLEIRRMGEELASLRRGASGEGQAARASESAAPEGIALPLAQMPQQQPCLPSPGRLVSNRKSSLSHQSLLKERVLLVAAAPAYPKAWTVPLSTCHAGSSVLLSWHLSACRRLLSNSKAISLVRCSLNQHRESSCLRPWAFGHSSKPTMRHGPSRRHNLRTRVCQHFLSRLLSGGSNSEESKSQCSGLGRIVGSPAQACRKDRSLKASCWTNLKCGHPCRTVLGSRLMVLLS